MNQGSDLSPCVTIQLCGGLGNQLFQYAAARSLAAEQGAQVLLDISFYDRGRHREFELGQFPIQAATVGRATAPRWFRALQTFGERFFRIDSREYHEPHFHFDPQLMRLPLPVVLKGYFQSPRYFERHAEHIQRELQPPPATSAQSQSLAQLLANEDSVSVHVRRGDYITNPKTRKTFYECSVNYYTTALKQIPGHGPAVVFSDDIQWAQANLPRTRDLVFADTPAGSGLTDLWLMTQAQHHIIANSTFSWWGAWLANKRLGMTIAPRHWFCDPRYDARDLLPAHWVQV